MARTCGFGGRNVAAPLRPKSATFFLDVRSLSRSRNPDVMPRPRKTARIIRDVHNFNAKIAAHEVLEYGFTLVDDISGKLIDVSRDDPVRRIGSRRRLHRPAHRPSRDHLGPRVHLSEPFARPIGRGQKIRIRPTPPNPHALTRRYQKAQSLDKRKKRSGSIVLARLFHLSAT